jgi:hypothetical protein
MYEIRQVGILSVALAFGGMSAAFGLVIGVFVSIMSAGLSSLAGGHGMVSVFFGIGGIIVLPLMYGIGGFIGGLISAFVYNIVANFIGGVRIKLVKQNEQGVPTQTPVNSARTAESDAGATSGKSATAGDQA